MKRRLLRMTLLAAALTVLAASALPALAQQTVIIPTRVIYPGEIVTTDSLQEVPLRRQVRNIAAVAVDWGQLEGKVARRTLLPGRMIPVGSVRDAWLVEPGRPVRVQFLYGGLEITVSAVSLQAGAEGDLVRVRNADSGVVFTGTVMADGTIQVSAS